MRANYGDRNSGENMIIASYPLSSRRNETFENPDKWLSRCFAHIRGTCRNCDDFSPFDIRISTLICGSSSLKTENIVRHDACMSLNIRRRAHTLSLTLMAKLCANFPRINYGHLIVCSIETVQQFILPCRYPLCPFGSVWCVQKLYCIYVYIYNIVCCITYYIDTGHSEYGLCAYPVDWASRSTLFSAFERRLY